MILVLFASYLLFVPSAAKDTRYNYFDFVRQWTPNTCYKSTHECSHLMPEIKDTWTIHGLWPSLDAKHYPSNCAGSLCNFNSSEIADLAPEMHLEWPTDFPGGDTKFWLHEYCKHGTCCTDVLPTEHDFFSMALSLHKKLNIEDALSAAGITPQLDVTYTMKEMKQAMETSFGVTDVVYWCRFVKDGNSSKQLLYQISICVSKEFDVINCPDDTRSCVDEKPVYLLPFSIL